MERRGDILTYRAAVIGLGVMGNIADGLGGRHPEWYKPCCHADAYDYHPQTELVAGATRNPKRQKLFREKRGDKPVYSDYREMLEKEKIDIVSIATPATCHAEMTIEAAQAGVKGIYCEKVMATSLAECDAMIESCEKAGAVLIINHQGRWDDRYIALKRFIEEGHIGTLQAIQINFGGGRLCRGGSHMFDLALMFANDKVVAGCGWLSDADSFDPGGIGIFETQLGIRILIDGFKGMNHQFQADFIGEQGIIRVIDGGFQFEYWNLDQSSEFGLMVKKHLPMNFPICSPMLNAIDNLIYSIKTGDEPRSSGYHGREAFEMITAIHQSHYTERSFISFPLEDRQFRIESN